MLKLAELNFQSTLTSDIIKQSKNVNLIKTKIFITKYKDTLKLTFINKTWVTKTTKIEIIIITNICSETIKSSTNFGNTIENIFIDF